MPFSLVLIVFFWRFIDAFKKFFKGLAVSDCGRIGFFWDWKESRVSADECKDGKDRQEGK